MRRLLVVPLVLGVTACGGSHKLSAQKVDVTPAQKADAEKIAKTCLKQDEAKGAKAVFHCAVPPHHGLAFLKCAVSGLKNTSPPAIEQDAIKCGERYR